MATKNWVFTLNNYTQEEEKKLQEYDFNYIIYGYEKAPTTGTIHLQGYMQFKKRVKIGYIKKHINSRLHLEQARGSYDANREYC